MLETTLVIPAGEDVERDAVAAAWAELGGAVCPLDRFWEPSLDLQARSVCLYGNIIFCEILAQALGVQLVSPVDDLIISLPRQHRGRQMLKLSLAEIDRLEYPCFVKPVQPKLFTAGVFQHTLEVELATKGLDSTTEVVVSEVVDFCAEARTFIHGSSILDIAMYQGAGELTSARELATEIAQLPGMPLSYVLDLGRLEDGSWAVVEFNPAWGAGLNGCSAPLVIPAIAAATQPS